MPLNKLDPSLDLLLFLSLVCDNVNSLLHIRTAQLGWSLLVRHRTRSRSLLPHKCSNDYDPDESDQVRELVRWIESAEYEGYEATCIGIDRRARRRGLYSRTTDFEPGEFILAVPFTSTLPLYEDRQNEESVVDADVLMGLQFLQRSMSNETWQPYINSLPVVGGPDFDATPDFWAMDEIKQLEIPKLIEESLRRKRNIEQLAIRLADDNFSYPLARLQWATWAVRSRGFTTLKMLSKDDELTIQARTVLLPYLDMVNHCATPNAVLEVWEVPDAYDESFYALKAVRPILKGEEITIAYGTGMETSLDLFAKYGFWPAENPGDRHLDWASVDAQWTTTLEEDLALLAQTKKRECLHAILLLRINLKALQRDDMSTT